MLDKTKGKLATVFIPTYGRPRYLERSLEYWGRSKYPVFIADSSVEKYNKPIPDNCHYEHMPNTEYYKKCLDATNKISSKYIVPCADDDFHALGGVESAILFLENNSRYTTAKGRSIDFVFEDGNINIYPIYTSDRDIKDKLLQLRMQNSLFPWLSNYWAVYRSEIYTSCLETVMNLEDMRSRIHAFEISVALVPAMFGYIKVLEEFYTARAYLPRYSGFPSELEKPYLWVRTGDDDYQRWKENILQLSNCLSMDIDLVKTYLEQSMKYFLNGDEDLNDVIYPRAIPKTLKQRIKKIIPSIVLDWYRTIRYRKKKGKRGYPWLDRKSAEDWQMIKSVIDKYGDIGGVSGETVRSG